MTLTIIILGAIAIIGLTIFSIGLTLNTKRFEQVFSEKKILIPCLTISLLCELAVVILVIMEVL